MKKFLSLLLALVLLFSTVSCAGGSGDDGTAPDTDNTPDNGTGDGGEDKVDQDCIYSTEALPTIILADKSAPDEITNKIYNAIKSELGSAPYSSGDSGEASDHEIVIGKSERTVSKYAYTELKRMRPDSDSETICWVIYSDGRSIAIAYEEDADAIGLSTAASALLKIISGKDKLTLERGIVDSGEKSIDEFFADKDNALLDAKWTAFAAKLDAEYRDEVVSAMKDLYKLYSDDLIGWFVNLYDPAIGGFYYSNSGRNTYGYLPDIESTAQTLGFINKSGMAEEYGGYANMLPEEVKHKIVYFIKSLQDPNGYFYHPQWPRELSDSKLSRLSRDLSNGVSVLHALGSKPTYKTPNGDKGDGVTAEQYAEKVGLTARLSDSSAALASRVVLTAASPIAHLENKDTFLAYLETLDIANKSYSVGNTLTAQKNAIIQRDKELKAAGANYSLMDILINWLNKNQHADTGLWHSEINYYAINGLMKISGVYGGAEVLLPNAEKAVKAAIAAIESDEVCGAVVDIYNTWYATERVLRHMDEYGNSEERAAAEKIREELRANSADALYATAEKLASFRKDDGSFSYTVKGSSANSQGCPVAVPDTNEGDVNATVICSSDILYYLYSALGLRDVFVPIYTKSDARRFLEDLAKLTPVVKDVEQPNDEPNDFDIGDLGTKPEGVTVNDRSSASGGYIKLENGYADNKTQVVAISSKNGTSDSLKVNCANYSPMSCYVFECDIAVESASGYFAQITLGDVYMFTLRNVEGKLSIIESSSSSSKKSRDTVLVEDVGFGKWFNVKVEYFRLENGEARIKFYYNGKLIAVTDNYYCEDGSKLTLEPGAKVSAPSEYKSALFWFMKSIEAKVYIDNLACYKSNEVYEPVTGSGAPSINVDAK